MNITCPTCGNRQFYHPVNSRSAGPTRLRSIVSCNSCESPFAIELETVRTDDITDSERREHFPEMRVTKQGGGCPKCEVGVPSIEEDFLMGYIGHSCSCGHKWQESGRA